MLIAAPFILLLLGTLLSVSSTDALSSNEVNSLRASDHTYDARSSHLNQDFDLDKDLTEELVKNIENKNFFDEDHLREALKLLTSEMDDKGQKLPRKYGNSYDNVKTQDATSDDKSILDRGIDFIKGLLDGGSSSNSTDPQSDDTPSTDDESIMDDMKKYLEGIIDPKSGGAFEGILKYIVSYVHRNVHFWLFTKGQNGYQDLTIGKLSNISRSSFNKRRKTVILIHGWINSGDNYYAQAMINAYDSYGDYNIISVDWSKLSYSLYTLSRVAVNFVGPYVAKMIDCLISIHEIKPTDVHILGHSLGAHIAGIAGMFVKNGKVGRITGFDPASPLFGNDEKYRLDAIDAKFVDVIHTSILGMDDSLGDADFFPNGGGPSQPGCGFDIVCPHRRSYRYYIASMKDNNFLAFPCDSWESFQDGNCTTGAIHMGMHTPRKAKGCYFLKTASESPFAIGVHALDASDDTTPIPIHPDKTRNPTKHRHPKPHHKHHRELA